MQRQARQCENERSKRPYQEIRKPLQSPDSRNCRSNSAIFIPNSVTHRIHGNWVNPIESNSLTSSQAFMVHRKRR